MKSNSTRKKINQIFDDTNNNQINLELNENTIDRFFNSESHKYSSHEIYDSDWVIHTPTNSDGDTRTINKGDLLPEIVSKEFDIDISIPEEYLPFLRFEKTIKPLPECQAVAISPTTTSSWEDRQYVKIQGDVSKIYDGPIGSDVNLHDYILRGRIHTQEELDNEYFSEGLTKKTYTGILEYTYAGQLYKIEGNIGKILLQFDASYTGCNANLNQTLYEIQYHPNVADFLNYSEITTINSALISGQVRKTLDVWEDRGEGCQLYQTITEDFTGSKNWNDVDAQITFPTATRYIWSGGEWVSLGSTSNFMVDEVNIGHVITSQEFSFQGYLLFYSTQTRWLFGLSQNGDGEYITLDTPPDTGGDPAISLPYTQITVEQNYDDYPDQSTSEQSLFYSIEDHKNEKFYQINESIAPIPKYKVISTLSCVINAPAIVESDNSPSFNVYDNINTVVGDTYIETTTDKTEKTKIEYASECKDVYVRLRITLINPLFYKEDKRYING